MMKLAIVIVAAVAPIAALAAPPLVFSGSEQLFGPAPPGAPYFTLPEGAPLDPKNSYIAVGVTGNRSGFVRVENLLTASSRLASKRVSEGTALAGSITSCRLILAIASA